MFERALRQLDGIDVSPDLVVITGDIVDHGTSAEYEQARLALSAVRQPVLLLPGNHDQRDAFRRAFPDQPYHSPTGPLHFDVGDRGPVRVIGLDVTVPAEHHGDADEVACAWLADRLGEEPERPTVVMMHQPPVESGIACIDVYNCRCASRLSSGAHVPPERRPPSLWSRAPFRHGTVRRNRAGDGTQHDDRDRAPSKSA